MLHTKTQDEFGTWGIHGRKPQIVYGTALMSALAGEAKSAGRKPIGGVLFGTSSEADTRILAYRVIECQDEDKGGAPFSEAGEVALGRLAEAYSEDVSLTGMQPVGWYRSCWESGIQLNQEDLRVWNRFFPLPSQVSLVLRVQENAPVRAGFFFRPASGGPVRIDSSYRTFEIHTAPDAAGDFGRLADAVEAGARTSLPPGLEESPETGLEMEPPGELFTRPPPKDERRGMLWGAVALACLAAVAGWWWFPQERGSAGQGLSDIVLRFQGTPERLMLAWDPHSPQFQQADSAELRIIDGKSDSTMTLDSVGLRLGHLALLNRSGLIEAQMSIHLAGAGPGETVMAAANFVGTARTGAAVGGEGFDALRTEWAALDAQMRERIQARTALEARVRNLRQAGQSQPAAVAPGALAPATSQIEPSAAAPKPEPAVATPVRPVTTPAAVVSAERPVPTPPVLAPAFGSDRAPSRTPVGLPEPPAAPAYTGPASGKFIWTGYLAPGRTVTIDGRSATTGSVNGSLPGVPVRISVYPGEFSSAGLSVFSAASRHQAGPVTENRSAQNGWLNTRYVYDPARARDATVSSAPSEAGGFKQLQIACGERPVSVVVVEWSVIR